MVYEAKDEKMYVRCPKYKGSQNQCCADDCSSLSYGAHSGYYCNKYGIRLEEVETNDYGYVSAIPCNECIGLEPKEQKGSEKWCVKCHVEARREHALVCDNCGEEFNWTRTKPIDAKDTYNKTLVEQKKDERAYVLLSDCCNDFTTTEGKYTKHNVCLKCGNNCTVYKNYGSKTEQKGEKCSEWAKKFSKVCKEADKTHDRLNNVGIKQPPKKIERNKRPCFLFCQEPAECFDDIRKGEKNVCVECFALQDKIIKQTRNEIVKELEGMKDNREGLACNNGWNFTIDKAIQTIKKEEE